MANKEHCDQKKTVTDTTILTPRELLILELSAKGCTNKIIAERLFISVDTVKKHLKNIYIKLEVHKKIDALRKVGFIMLE